MCSVSLIIFVRSQLARTDRRFSGGAIPERVYSLFTGVFVKQPVIKRRHVSFKAIAIFFVCVDLLHRGLMKSSIEKHSAKAVILNVRNSK